MSRAAFKMKLKPGAAAEYKQRHDELWPELAAELKAAGVYDYSIFLDEETLTLFAVQKLSENNSAANLPIRPSSANGGVPWRRSWKRILIIRPSANRCAKFFIWTEFRRARAVKFFPLKKFPVARVVLYKAQTQ